MVETCPVRLMSAMSLSDGVAVTKWTGASGFAAFRTARRNVSSAV